jgi:hypothetical protein
MNMNVIDNWLEKNGDKKIKKQVKLILSDVSKCFTEKQMDDAYDKGYTDGINTGNTPM